MTAPTSRYEVGKSSTAAPRPTGGHRADYRFSGTIDAKIRRQRAKEVGYGIWNVCVDLTEAVEEVAPTTLEGVNARVTELVAVQEQDTQDIYVVIEDGIPYRLIGVTDDDIDYTGFITTGTVNNIPPRRSSATVRAAAVAARAAAPMTAAVVEQLIEARVSVVLANHDTLRNNTNGHADGSHNSDIGIRGTVRTPLFHISNCAMENQVKFATCTFLGNALTWWNSHMKTVTQDVVYAMDWKALKKTMTVKYCPRDEIKKLEIELWNLKVKEEVEKYIGGLPDMIRGNVMSYQPMTMEKAIEFANDQMD
ncbi:reverse transcriptase domain-containing protein [Tanacetum coccineum]